MTTTTLRNDILAQVSHDIRRATSPSLPLSAKSLDEQRMELLAQAQVCHREMEHYRAAGDDATARAYLRRGLALKAEMQKLEAHNA